MQVTSLYLLRIPCCKKPSHALILDVSKANNKMSFLVLFLLPMINKHALKPKSCINKNHYFFLLSNSHDQAHLPHSDQFSILGHADEFKNSSAFFFSMQCFSITNLWNLGHWEPGILPFLCTRQSFLAAIFIPLVLKFSILSQW